MDEFQQLRAMVGDKRIIQVLKDAAGDALKGNDWQKVQDISSFVSMRFPDLSINDQISVHPVTQQDRPRPSKLDMEGVKNALMTVASSVS